MAVKEIEDAEEARKRSHRHTTSMYYAQLPRDVCTSIDNEACVNRALWQCMLALLLPLAHLNMTCARDSSGEHLGHAPSLGRAIGHTTLITQVSKGSPFVGVRDGGHTQGQGITYQSHAAERPPPLPASSMSLAKGEPMAHSIRTASPGLCISYIISRVRDNMTGSLPRLSPL